MATAPRVLHARRCFSCLLGISACLLASIVRAESRCSVEIVADIVNSAWSSATDELAERLMTAGPASACSAIHLCITGDGAELVLVTADGRRAVRRFAEPAELVPTVEAILVTFDADVAAPSPSVFEERRSSAATEIAAARPSAIVARPTTNVVLGALIAVRAGDHLATPVIGAVAAVASGPWEMGVNGQWEISYESTDNHAASAWSATGFAAGVALGRRQSVSSTVAIRAGVTLAGAVLHQETHHVRPERWMTRADGRLGAYTGAVFPLSGLLRFRGELAVDCIPFIGQTQAASPDIPSLPRWTASLAIGAETSGL